jgi:hypothetical protein
MEKTRHSRKFACERCRNYKLRCERSGASPRGNSCDRCLRTGAMCVAASKTAEPRSLQPYASPRHSFGGDLGTIAVRTPHAAGASLPPVDQQQTRPSTAYIEVDDFGADLERIDPAICNTTRRQSSLGFSLSNFTFPSNVQDTRNTPKPLDRRGSNTGSLSSMFGDMTELGNPAAAVLPSPDSFDAPLTTRPQLNTHREAFELGARLAEDYATLTDDKYQNPAATAIERALGATSQLCEILQCLARQESLPAGDANRQATAHLDMNLLTNPFLLQTAPNQAERVGTLQRSEDTGQTGLSTGGNASTTTTSHRRTPDILLVTTLVTTYILLMRNWRCIFSRLLDQLDSRSGDTAGANVLELPGVQMGGFQIPSNPAIQIPVLLELTSGMLHTIETALGLTYSAGCSSGRGREDGVNCWAVLIDPVAVSIRETLISQERVRTGREGNGGELSLNQMMERVKRQVEKTRGES